ncbi:protein of unknown function [Shewanella benthica]|uniref:Uncharacterized protein n=1 Tax=Shewanella benthica TaxID=43661 RepID=A0A330M273_9GAMM|nr:protein of unknown function [Shewanella benthica]
MRLIYRVLTSFYSVRPLFVRLIYRVIQFVDSVRPLLVLLSVALPETMCRHNY